jgi:hypothetical protein
VQVSDIEHSLIPLDYGAIKPGMEIITEDAMILGRTISVEYRSTTDSIDVFFVDTTYHILSLFSSIYRISSLEISTIGYNRIILSKDALRKIVETRIGIFKSIGLVDSLHAKIERKKAQYQRAESISKRSTSRYNKLRNTSEEDIWDEDDRIDRDSDEPPFSRVLVPKKPNPNLPPLMMDEDEDWPIDRDNEITYSPPYLRVPVPKLVDIDSDMIRDRH